MDEDLSSVYFEDLNTEVFGFSYHTPEILEDRTAQFTITNNQHNKILMIHGGDAKHLPFVKNVVAAMPFSYIALGHIHKPGILIENKMAYPGSPEPLDLTETGPHGYLLGELDEISGHVTSLEFRPIS